MNDENASMSGDTVSPSPSRLLGLRVAHPRSSLPSSSALQSSRDSMLSFLSLSFPSALTLSPLSFLLADVNNEGSAASSTFQASSGSADKFDSEGASSATSAGQSGAGNIGSSGDYSDKRGGDACEFLLLLSRAAAADWKLG